ncbi:MAG: translocation/assembly module TamB domain-containing protein, partial [Bdellovibrio sp.]
FSLRGKSSRVDALNLELKSKTPLRLLHLLVPGLEEISGDAEIDIKIGGSWLKPEIFGAGKLSRGFFKIPNFPHPLEKIEAKADFSKSFIQIPSIQGIFAGGNLRGEGQIEIQGPRNTPLDLKFKIEGAALNFPDKIKTSGNLELSLSRSWFPFLLSGSYQVTRGWIEKEFTEAEQTQNLKVSSYLPKNLVLDSIDPVEFDLQIQLDKSVKIKNSLADASVTGSIDVLGGPSAPEILGELMFEKGSQILVRDRVFDLSAGRLKFANPSELNPELFFQGRTRVGDYDVNLLVQGMAKDPQIRLSSSPPLPDKEIISLLALGMTSSTLERSQQQNATQGSTVDRVGTAILSTNPVTKRIQDNLGVELEISSSYDDKKNISSRRLTMSRRLNEKLRVSASRQQKEQSSTEFKAEYALTPQLSAVAAWENREPSDNRSITEDAKTESIFGLDLDFRREFK